MRTILLILAAILLAAAPAAAANLKPLFDAAQAQGVDSELRGDIADRLGFGEDGLLIKDLVVTEGGVQHAVNAFRVDGRPYLLFDSHLYVPEVYIFVRSLDGALVSGIHGRQYQPITDTIDMVDGAAVIGAEETFWLQWLAGAPTKK
ncbi:MAG: hypothetical protein K1X51_16440 [Rhodospirillaceae bacterium]|nr:hypothetical protein [Rhodospirillaceae bacterium]